MGDIDLEIRLNIERQVIEGFRCHWCHAIKVPGEELRADSFYGCQECNPYHKPKKEIRTDRDNALYEARSAAHEELREISFQKYMLEKEVGNVRFSEYLEKHSELERKRKMALGILAMASNE